MCRESFPHERSLVERMKGRPFILLGVNSDSPEVAAEVDREQGIAERSWRDGGEVNGGEIAHRWNVRALPTTYIIDHRGIIRYKLGPRPMGTIRCSRSSIPRGRRATSGSSGPRRSPPSWTR